VKSSENQDVH